MTTNKADYTVTSEHFNSHPVISCGSYSEALKAAKERGFDALIHYGETLVASWSGAFGVHFYCRELAQ